MGAKGIKGKKKEKKEGDKPPPPEKKGARNTYNKPAAMEFFCAALVTPEGASLVGIESGLDMREQTRGKAFEVLGSCSFSILTTISLLYGLL